MSDGGDGPFLHLWLLVWTIYRSFPSLRSFFTLKISLSDTPKVQQIVVMVNVLYTEDWVCDIALIECTLSLGKPKRGWDSGRELVYEQPGIEVDNSCHSWRVPSK
jgi:hypothetical protein